MITLQTLPPLILWVVVIIRLAGLRLGWKLGILPAMTMAALGATLNIDQVYLAVDHLLGNWNLLNLIVHLLMGAAMTDLSRLLLQVAGRPSQHIKVLLGMGVALAVVQMVLLGVSDTQGSATSFTDTFAAIPTVALYQASFFAWVGLVLGYTGVECLRRDSRGESRSFGIGIGIVSMGCLTGVAAVTMKTLLVVLAILDAGAAYKPSLNLAYRILIALTVVGFAVGFMIPSTGQIKTAIVARAKRAEAQTKLRPIVRRLSETPEGKRSMTAANVRLNTRGSKIQLYRWFIFLGDIRVLDPELLTSQEIQIIDEIGKKFDNNGSTDKRAMAGL